MTGCFETHLTHDLRGLSETELVVSHPPVPRPPTTAKSTQSLRHWKSFFANHADYPKIGTVLNPSIDPRSPIPAPCMEAAPGEQAARQGRGKPDPVKETGTPRRREL